MGCAGFVGARREVVRSIIVEGAEKVKREVMGELGGVRGRKGRSRGGRGGGRDSEAEGHPRVQRWGGIVIAFKFQVCLLASRVPPHLCLSERETNYP